MHKKLILTLLAVACAISLKAQTQKGNQLLGGFIGFTTGSGSEIYTPTPGYSTARSSKLKTTSFNIGPSYSVFIADGIDLGASAGYSYQKQTTTYPDNTFGAEPTKLDGRSFSASVYLRKYFLYANKIGLRTGPYLSYSYNKSTIEYAVNYYASNSSFTGKSYQGGINLDIVYFPAKRLGLATTLGSLNYNHTDNNQPSYAHSKTDTFGINVISSGLTLSVFYCF